MDIRLALVPWGRFFRVGLGDGGDLIGDSGGADGEGGAAGAGGGSGSGGGEVKGGAVVAFLRKCSF